MNKIFRIALPFIVILFFTSCGVEKLNLSTMTSPKLTKPIVANGLTNMRRDTANVLLAISAKILKSKRKTGNVIFQQPFKLKFTDANLFNFKNAILLSYRNHMGNKNIDADLFFKDSIGRNIVYNIRASYRKQDGKIFISKLNIKDKFSHSINTICFILPAEKVLKLEKEGIPKNFYKLYHFAATNAIIPEQASEYKNKSSWAIMVFALDRISKHSKMTLGISGDKKSYNIDNANSTKYINYNGWVVGIIAGRFYLLDPNNTKKLYAKVVFRLNKNSTLKKPEIIALYRLK